AWEEASPKTNDRAKSCALEKKWHDPTRSQPAADQRSFDDSSPESPDRSGACAPDEECEIGKKLLRANAKTSSPTNTKSSRRALPIDVRAGLVSWSHEVRPLHGESATGVAFWSEGASIGNL